MFDEWKASASADETMEAWQTLCAMWYADKGLNVLAREAKLEVGEVVHMAERHPCLPYSLGFCRAVRKIARRYGVVS